MDRRPGEKTDALAMARRRDPPRFYVVDASLHVLFRSEGDADSTLELPHDVAAAVRSVIPQLDATDDATHVAMVSDSVLVRVLKLEGHESAPQFGVFIERFVVRNSIAAAVRRFELTRREAEVLEGLLQGHSTETIADRLCIAESTVSEHVRNISRKTSATRRGEIVAAVIGLRDERERPERERP